MRKALIAAVVLAVGVSILFRLYRRIRVALEAYVHHHLPGHVHPETPPREAGKADLARLGDVGV